MNLKQGRLAERLQVENVFQQTHLKLKFVHMATVLMSTVLCKQAASSLEVCQASLVQSMEHKLVFRVE